MCKMGGGANVNVLCWRHLHNQDGDDLDLE